MISAYALQCRRMDVGILENTFTGEMSVQQIHMNELGMIEKAPDVLFVGYNEQHHGPDADTRSLSVVRLLLSLRSMLAFRDIPTFLIAEASDARSLYAGIRKLVSGVLVTPLTDDGLRGTIRKAMKPVGKEAALDVNLVNPFVSSTVNVLKTMARTEAVRKEIFLKKDYRMFGDVSAVIGIMGDKLEGTVAITFHQDLAHAVVSRMLGLELSQVGFNDVHDGLGELVNMISGSAKTALSSLETYRFNLALPTIITGIGHEISHRPGTPCLVIVFEADGMPFAVQVAIGQS